jgi:hypothetical protein
MEGIRQLTEGVADSDLDVDVVDGHLTPAPRLGHMQLLNTAACGSLVGRLLAIRADEALSINRNMNSV